MKLTNSIIVLILTVLLKTVVFSQATFNTTNCFPEVLQGIDCFPFNISREITLPAFPDCKLKINGELAICNGQIYLHASYYEFGEGCTSLLDRLQNNLFEGQEFRKWFEKQIFYNFAIALFNEMIEKRPNNSLYCPGGFVSITGYIEQCAAYETYKGINWDCPLCNCCPIWRTRKIDCSGYGCCELTVKICMDKITNKIEVTETSSPIPGQCENSTPFSGIPPVPEWWGTIDWMTPCQILCTNQYGYGSPAPAQ